jgi:integrase
MTRRGKNEGNIRKRKDGRWEAALSVGYTAKGNPKRVSVYGQTRAEVATKLFHLGSKYGKGLLANPDKITVSEFLHQWLEDKSDTKKPTTVAGYRNAVEKHIVPKLGKVRLQQLQPVHVQNLYRELRRDTTDKDGKIQKGLGNSLRLVHCVLRDAFKRAVKLDIVSVSPISKVDAPSVTRFDGKAWTADQAKAFLEASRSSRWCALFHLALTTGMRRGELLGLFWEDIDFAAKKLMVRRSYTTAGGKPMLLEPKTHRSTRPVALTAWDMRVLEDHRAGQQAERELGEIWQEDQWVFSTGIGTPINPANLSREFKRIVKLANVPDIRFHDLRHSSASLAILAGVELKVLSERLGHSSTRITSELYQHTYSSQHEEAADALGALLEPKEKVK